MVLALEVRHDQRRNRVLRFEYGLGVENNRRGRKQSGVLGFYNKNK